MNGPRLLTFILVLSATPAVVQAVDFGRLFTTPSQRQQLDELRRTQPAVVVEVSSDELEVDQGPARQDVEQDKLKIKGLVYRSDGKSTVWINESNSYEGDLSSDYTHVDSGRIHRDGVDISLPGEQLPLSMKVGQSLDPKTLQLSDVTDKTESAGDGTAVQQDDR